MTTATMIAPVTKSIRVKASQGKAFKFFTENLGRWWPSNFSIGGSPMKNAIMEPGAGGRWYEVGEDGTTCEWGEVLAWNPPHGVTLAWRIRADWQFDPDLLTEVHVIFKAVSDRETEVTLEHRKLENYGEAAPQIVGVFDSPGGWAGALTRFGEGVETV